MASFRAPARRRHPRENVRGCTGRGAVSLRARSGTARPRRGGAGWGGTDRLTMRWPMWPGSGAPRPSRTWPRPSCPWPAPGEFASHPRPRRRRRRTCRRAAGRTGKRPTNLPIRVASPGETPQTLSTALADTRVSKLPYNIVVRVLSILASAPPADSARETVGAGTPRSESLRPDRTLANGRSSVKHMAYGDVRARRRERRRRG